MGGFSGRARTLGLRPWDRCSTAAEQNTRRTFRLHWKCSCLLGPAGMITQRLPRGCSCFCFCTCPRYRLPLSLRMRGLSYEHSLTKSFPSRWLAYLVDDNGSLLLSYRRARTRSDESWSNASTTCYCFSFIIPIFLAQRIGIGGNIWWSVDPTKWNAQESKIYSEKKDR